MKQGSIDIKRIQWDSFITLYEWKARTGLSAKRAEDRERREMFTKSPTIIQQKAKYFIPRHLYLLQDTQNKKHMQLQPAIPPSIQPFLSAHEGGPYKVYELRTCALLHSFLPVSRRGFFYFKHYSSIQKHSLPNGAVTYCPKTGGFASRRRLISSCHGPLSFVSCGPFGKACVSGVLMVAALKPFR